MPDLIVQMCDDALGKKQRYCSVRQKRPLSAPDAEEQTDGCEIDR